MASRNPRVLLSARCRSCTPIASARRPFTTSPALRQIPPESPRYVEIPRPPQQYQSLEPTVKGTLPVPRNIFAGRRTQLDKEKDAESFAVMATAEPTAAQSEVRGPQAARVAWKERIAATRRRNLREGLVKLRDRKKSITDTMSAHSTRRQQERKALINAPEREDERLTNPSVSKAAQKLLQKKRGPSEQITSLEKKRENVLRRERQKSQARKDAIHTLYMHARSFIINEKQLDEAIEEAFGTLEHPARWGPNALESVWGEGAPDSVTDILNRATRRGGYAMGRSTGYENITQKRMKRIAEEFTGGKMSDENLHNTSGMENIPDEFMGGGR